MSLRLRNRVCLLLCLLLCLLCHVSSAAEIERAADAPQPLSPEESASRMRLPDGFRIELVASEPLIQEPSCIAFDEYGRLFVTELHGYNVEGELDVVELNKTGKLDREVRRLRWEFIGGEVAEKAKQLQFGKLKLLTDKDGDGRMDSAEVWADDLPPAYGVIPAHGGVVVVAAPDILFFADRDGDGKADVRKTIFTGFHKREMERGINNPRRGPDNWIYVGAGGHGGTIRRPESIYDDDAKELPPVELSHSDFRINLVLREIEPVTGRVGTFGLAMNDVGDRFPCSGGQPAVYALPMDYKLLARNPWVKTPSMNYNAANYNSGFRISDPHPWRVQRRSDPAWIKFYGNRETDSNYFTGGCGGEIYNADVFPKQYRGNFFYCEPSLNIVHRCELTRDGAGYQARRAAGEEESEFLASTDQWFRPMNLRTGSDGALYIVDMYREIIEDYSAIPRFLQQQYGLDRGRDKGRIWRLIANDVPSAKSLVSFTAGLRFVHHLSSEKLVELLESPNVWNRNAAQRLLLENYDRRGRPRILMDFDVGAVLRKLLRETRSPLARIHALHLLSNIDQMQDSDLSMALADSDYRVRLHGLKLLSHRLPSGEQRSAIAAMTDDVDAAVRLHIPFTNPGIATLRNLAKQHGTERWMDAAILSSVGDPGDLLAQILSETQASDGERRLIHPLAATVAGRGDSEAISTMLELITKCDDTTTEACLEGLLVGLSRGHKRVQIADEKLLGLVQLLRQEISPEVFLLAARVGAKVVDPTDSFGQTLFDRTTTVATAADGKLDARAAAVSILADAPFESLATVAGDMLDSRQPLELQQAAIESVGRSSAPGVAALLLNGWEGYTPNIRKLIVKALLARKSHAASLLDAVESNIVRASELSATQQEQLKTDSIPSIAERAKKLFALSVTDEMVASLIGEYTKALAGDHDAANGKVVFDKTCLNCHKLGDAGHEVGPALGSIINKPDEAILADMLDPSSKIDSEFTSYSVVTETGKVFTGVLASESPTSVTLKMEKGLSETVLRNEIDTIKSSGVSLMPSNLHEQIPPKAMADLLTYIREAYGPK